MRPSYGEGSRPQRGELQLVKREGKQKPGSRKELVNSLSGLVLGVRAFILLVIQSSLIFLKDQSNLVKSILNREPDKEPR